MNQHNLVKLSMRATLKDKECDISFMYILTCNTQIIMETRNVLFLPDNIVSITNESHNVWYEINHCVIFQPCRRDGARTFTHIHVCISILDKHFWDASLFIQCYCGKIAFSRLNILSNSIFAEMLVEAFVTHTYISVYGVHGKWLTPANNNMIIRLIIICVIYK